jgi:hypothetical protein
LLAATPGFDDHIAIRQLSPNAHRATLRAVLVPAIVMPAIIMSMNHDIVAIMDNNLRGRRNSAQKHRSHSRSQNDQLHLSLLLRFPRVRKRRSSEIVSYNAVSHLG